MLLLHSKVSKRSEKYFMFYNMLNAYDIKCQSWLLRVLSKARMYCDWCIVYKEKNLCFTFYLNTFHLVYHWSNSMVWSSEPCSIKKSIIIKMSKIEWKILNSQAKLTFGHSHCACNVIYYTAAAEKKKKQKQILHLFCSSYQNMDHCWIQCIVLACLKISKNG